MIKTPHKVDLPLPKRDVSDPDALAGEIMEKLTYSIGKDAKVATPHDWLTATILVVRDRIIDTWMESTRTTYMNNGKRVYYLSLEFLIGRLLRDAMSNLGLIDDIRQALQSLSVEFDVIAGLEPMRHLAMAASVVLRPVSWNRWRPSTSRPMAMASAMCTASSVSRWRMAGRSSFRKAGCPRQSLGIRTP